MELDAQHRKILAQRELRHAHCIPYAYHLDEHTLVTRDLALVQVIQLQGLPSNTMSAEDAIAAKHRRNALYREIADPRLTLYSYTIHRPASVTSDKQYATPFLQRLHDAWYADLNTGNLLVTEHYLVLVYRPDWGATAALKHLLRKLQFIKASETQETIKDAQKTLHRLANKVKGRFTSYNVKRLGVQRTGRGATSEILSFLHYLINGEAKNRQLPTMDLAQYLGTNSLIFNLDHFVIRTPSRLRYGAVLGVKGLEYPSTTDQGLLDPLAALGREFIVTQSFQFQNKKEAMDSAKLKLKQMESAEDDAISVLSELEASIDELASNKMRLGTYHFSVTLLADSRKELEASIEDADKALAECNIACIREDMNMEAAFWAQLPGNESYRARCVQVTSKNFAGLASFHGEPLGRQKNNRWGDAITCLKTVNGAPYFFNFHVAPEDRLSGSNDDDASDKGHTSIIGPNGSGKTLLICFLLALLMHLRYRLVYFDKDRASEIFIRALGGQYSVIHPDYDAGFNPLQLQDTKANREFLNFWFALLLTANGETLSAPDRAMIERAVEGNYKLDFEDRRLSNVLAYFSDFSLKQRLTYWCKGQLKGYLFDNSFDTFELSSGVVGLDLSHVLNDPIIQKPVIAYLFHRIHNSLDGTPTVVNFEEGWAYLKNEAFAEHMRNELKTIRKKEGLVIFSSQDPADSADSSIKTTLNQEIATQIWFGNPKAQKSHYCDHFMLTERQYEIVRGMDPTDRKALLIQGRDSVVLDLDMSNLASFFPVLSGRIHNVRLMETIRTELGEEPEQWLNRFLQSAEA